MSEVPGMMEKKMDTTIEHTGIMGYWTKVETTILRFPQA